MTSDAAGSRLRRPGPPERHPPDRRSGPAGGDTVRGVPSVAGLIGTGRAGRLRLYCSAAGSSPPMPGSSSVCARGTSGSLTRAFSPASITGHPFRGRRMSPNHHREAVCGTLSAAAVTSYTAEQSFGWPGDSLILCATGCAERSEETRQEYSFENGKPGAAAGFFGTPFPGIVAVYGCWKRRGELGGCRAGHPCALFPEPGAVRWKMLMKQAHARPVAMVFRTCRGRVPRAGRGRPDAHRGDC